MTSLSVYEALEVSEAFLLTLYGPELYERWKDIKVDMGFTTERLFIAWLLDVVQGQGLGQGQGQHKGQNKRPGQSDEGQRGGDEGVDENYEEDMVGYGGDMCYKEEVVARCDEILLDDEDEVGVGGEMRVEDEIRVEDEMRVEDKMRVEDEMRVVGEMRVEDEMVGWDGVKATTITSNLPIQQHHLALPHHHKVEERHGGRLVVDTGDDDRGVTDKSSCWSSQVKTEDSGGGGVGLGVTGCLGKPSHCSPPTTMPRLSGVPRNYACDECDYRARSWADLKKHRNRHTKERPYQCAVCAKNYTNMSNLYRHQKGSGHGVVCYPGVVWRGDT